MTQKLLTGKWLSFTYSLANNLCSGEDISAALKDFHRTVLQYLSNDQCLLIIFKIQSHDNIIRSISSVQRINKNTDISEEFIEFWELRIDNYQQFTIKNILFNYFIIKNKDKTIKPKISKSSKQNEIKSSNLLRIGSLNFPKTMDLFQWGQVHFILEDSEAIYIKVNPELDTSSSL